VRSHTWFRAGATVVVGGLLALGVAAPAWAAPGDATATALQIGLSASGDDPEGVIADALVAVADWSGGGAG